MRALTVLQPWSWAIAHAGKGVENRSRSFAYRGPLAIHAGRAWEPFGSRSPKLREAFAPFRPAYARGRDLEPWESPRFVAGAVVAVTELVDVHRGVGCCQPWGFSENLRLSAAGRPVFHLVLSGTRALEEPVPCRGAQGLWRLPADVSELVAQQVTPSSGPSSPSSVGPGAGV